MYVEVKSANGISIEPIETSLLAKRIIILDKNIDAQTALEVIKQLIVLGKEKDEPIKMLIHSVGGEIDAGMMIIDAMKSLNVHTYVWELPIAWQLSSLQQDRWAIAICLIIASLCCMSRVSWTMPAVRLPLSESFLRTCRRQKKS